MMDKIICGRFQTKVEADKVAVNLANYVDEEDMTIFHSNPPGQHDAFPIGGDEDADPAARHAESPGTAAAAGLTAGAIGLAVGGPVVGLAAAGVAAYTGSLLGAMQGLKEESSLEPDRRQGGVFLAVRVTRQDVEQRVINELKRIGAADIEKTVGEWRDGTWVDFNPVAVPKLLVNQDRGPTA